MLGFGAESCMFKSDAGKDWENFTDHPAVIGFLTIVGEGLRWRKERILEAPLICNCPKQDRALQQKK